MPVAETNSPTWASNIQLGVATGLRNTAVALPGIVVSYDAASQTATVQPAIERLVPSEQDNDEDETETLPPVQHVPVMWLVGRGIQVKATLQKGDTVLLVACDRDFSAWSRSGDVQPPDDARTHHWQNAVAIPGLVPDSSPFPAPTDAAALASKVDAFIKAISILPLAVTPVDAVAGYNAIVAAAGAVLPPLTPPGPSTPGAPNPLVTSGSAILKLGS